MSSSISRNLILFNIHEFLRKMFQPSGTLDTTGEFLQLSSSYLESTEELRELLSVSLDDLYISPYDKAVALHMHGQHCHLSARVLRCNVQALPEHDPGIFENPLERRQQCASVAEKPKHTDISKVTRRFYRAYIMDAVDLMMREGFQEYLSDNFRTVALLMRIQPHEAAQICGEKMSCYVYDKERVQFDIAGRRVIIGVSVTPSELEI